VLSAWLTLYFTLPLALFMYPGAARVMRKLARVLAWAKRGVTVKAPSEEALSNARARLGAAGRRADAAAVFEGGRGSSRRPGAGRVVAGAAAGVAGRHHAGRAG
jgi:Insertion element 4 transposase N-terminal